jgi:arylsulfatase A-like enzyme
VQRASDGPLTDLSGRSRHPAVAAGYHRGVWRHLSVLVVIGGCSSPAVPVLDARLPAGNVLLICVDTLRADALGAYGQRLPTSPAIDDFAAESVVFDRAWTQYTWTLPSYVSFMTSTFARTHGWRATMARFETYPRMDDDIPTLASTLRAAGWATNAQIGNGHLTKDLAFDQGFDTWVNGLDRGVVRGAQADLQHWARDGRPNFLYVHFKGPHVALVPTPESLAAIGSSFVLPDKKGIGYEYYYDARPELKAAHLADFRAAYHASVRDADTRVAQVLEALDASGEADRTVVAVFADHGEMLGSSGLLGHNRSVREEVTRVPLIVRVPGQAPARVRSEVGRLIDLAPSVLDAVGVPLPPEWQGTSWYGLRTDPYTIVERDDLTAVTRDGRWRLVTEGATAARAFDLSHDEDELEERDISEVPELVAAEQAWRAATPEGSAGPLREAFDDEERVRETARLKALGYVQ